MSTKHTATLPDNTVATRTSANRVYPFTVAVGPEPKAERIARLISKIENRRAEGARYTATADYAEQGRPLAFKQGNYDKADNGKWVSPNGAEYGRQYTYTGAITVWSIETDGTEAGARAAIVTTFREYAANAVEGVADLERQLADAKTGPELIGGWHVSGWQSRADLAAKEQGKMQGVYPLRTVVILEVTIVTK